MAITRVQGNARGITATNSLTVTMASTPTSGNLLVIGFVSEYNGTGYITVSSISQTGVTWTGSGLGLQVQKQYINYYNVEIWVGLVGAGASTTCTLTLSGSPTYGAVANICEYSGLATSSFLDKTATSSGNVPIKTGTTATTSQATELWIGCGCTGFATLTTPTNGFTLLDGAQSLNGVSAAYLEYIANATGTANSGVSGGGGSYAGCIATFKEAVAAGQPYISRVQGVAGMRSW